MRRTLRFAIPIVLLVILGVVGYAVYRQSTSSKAPTAPSRTLRDTQRTSPQASLTAEQERALLQPLPADASDEDKRTRAEQIAKLTQDGTRLSLGGKCRPSPLVLRTKLGSELSVTNQDDTTHTLLITDQSFTVEKGTTISIKTASFKGDFLYSLSCDNRGYVGYLIIKQ